MPTPIAHSLMGYVFFADRYKANWKLNRYDSLTFIVVANLADIDYVPGFLMGNPNKFHHGMTHSFTFAVLMGIVFGLFYYFKKHGDFLKYFSIFSLTYVSHLVLDFIGKDTKYPYGEQLFWPFSKIYALSPIAIFSDVYKASSSDVFFQSLFNWHNIQTAIMEVVILLPIVLLIAKKKHYNK